MQVQQESIFSSGLRSLTRAAFAVFGIFLGLIPVMLIMGGIADGGRQEMRPAPTIRMLPDAEGQRSPLKADSPLVLQLNITGLIGDDALSTQSIETMLMQSQEGRMGSGRVKAVLLKLNTPGGTVVDADGIYRAIKRYKEKYKVPVYAYVDGLCASGGMYVASAADKVFASKTSLVGSIGVIIPPFFNFSQAMETYGVSAQTVSAGNHKDMMNPTRAWTENESENFEQMTTFLYETFVDIVVENRNRVDRDKLVSDYGARVFPAPEAVWMGLIDEVEDNPDKILQRLAEDVEIASKDYQVVQLESRTWLGEIFSTANPLWSGTVKHEIQWLPGVDSKFAGQYMYLYTPGL